MTLYHLFAVACALAISSGQLLFKLSARSLNLGAGAHGAAFGYAAMALVIYGLATVGWILLLQHLPLSRAYPYMALSFVVVPLMSGLLLHEPLAWGDYAAMLLIVCGVLVAAFAGGGR